MKRLYIIGASGHGKVVADIALKLEKYDRIAFLDDNDGLETIMGLSVVGKTNQYDLIDKDRDEVIVAIGNAQIRGEIQKRYEDRGANIATLIHPNAVLGMNVSIGQGTVIMAGAVINADAKIGQGCIINTCASVDHDCRIDDYVHISVGTHICGGVIVEKMTWIGAGATVSNNVNICDRCMVGAGAVVVKDIIEQGTYVGVPARKLESL